MTYSENNRNEGTIGKWVEEKQIQENLHWGVEKGVEHKDHHGLQNGLIDLWKIEAFNGHLFTKKKKWTKRHDVP